MLSESPPDTPRPPVRRGGLLRCCQDAVPDNTTTPVEGEHHPCPYNGHTGNTPEKTGVRYANGAWQAAWIKDEPS